MRGKKAPTLPEARAREAERPAESVQRLWQPLLSAPVSFSAPVSADKAARQGPVKTERPSWRAFRRLTLIVAKPSPTPRA